MAACIDLSRDVVQHIEGRHLVVGHSGTWQRDGYLLPAELAYCQFLSAARSRNVLDMMRLSTGPVNRCLTLLQQERDFSVLFDMLCASYPPELKLAPVKILRKRAILNADFYSEHKETSTRILMLHQDGRWRLDSEIDRQLHCERLR
jgi:hypothetical protein